MAEKKQKEQSDEKTVSAKKRTRKRKTEITKKLEILKEIMKKGTQSQKDAIDKIITDYRDYCNLPNLEQQYKELGEKIKGIKENISQQNCRCFLPSTDYDEDGRWSLKGNTLTLIKGNNFGVPFEYEVKSLTSTSLEISIDLKIAKVTYKFKRV